MEIKQHTEGYNITMEAGETLGITINGEPAKSWTVANGKTAQISIRFDEEVIVV